MEDDILKDDPDAVPEDLELDEEALLAKKKKDLIDEDTESLSDLEDEELDEDEETDDYEDHDAM